MPTVCVAIVGAGPSGLACVRTLMAARTAGQVYELHVFDKGKRERDPNDPHDAANGFGGCGLFSDGKVSFAPAGTNVWCAADRPSTQAALDAWIDDLNAAGADLERRKMPEFKELPVPKDKWTLKPYESAYVTPETRQRFVDDMWKRVSKPKRCELHMETVVLKIEKTDDGKYRLIYQKNGEWTTYETGIFDVVVLAGGRYSPMFIETPFKKQFVRTEHGVRIVGPADHPFWKTLQGTDPKYVRRNTDWEYRTFCCCRGGEVAQTRYNGIVTYSGRVPDTGSTDESNVGFMARSYDPNMHVELPDPFDVPLQQLGDLHGYGHIHRAIKDFLKYQTTYSLPTEEQEREREQVTGGAWRQFFLCCAVATAVTACAGLVFPTYTRLDMVMLWAFMTMALGTMIDYLVEGVMQPWGINDFEDFRAVGPCLEAAGSYLETDYNHRVPGENVYVVGDSNGAYRGLTAAYVSGCYVGQHIVGNYGRPDLPRIVNCIVNERGYVQRMPKIKGHGGAKALYEIHIFLAPINPGSKEVEMFEDAVKRYNDIHYKPESNAAVPTYEMKACHLGLVLRDNKTEVRVLQSAQYFRSEQDTPAAVAAAARRQALWFTSCGFDVLRIKVEASLHGQDVPDIDGPEVYYEFHIKTTLCGDAESDIAKLVEVSKKLSAQFDRPVPLSINRGKGGQRFLNVRFYNCKKADAVAKVRLIEEALGDLFLKTISEVGVYDSYPAMDNGWIDD